MDEPRTDLTVEALPAREPENVNAVLAARARERGTSELWTTAFGGGMNAVLLWTQFPGLHWLAAAFGAVAGYGVWGLLDRARGELRMREDEPPGATIFLTVLRNAAGGGGWIAALFAIVSFMNAALGGLSIPGR